jgi:hypothetical protein
VYEDAGCTKLAEVSSLAPGMTRYSTTINPNAHNAAAIISHNTTAIAVLSADRVTFTIYSTVEHLGAIYWEEESGACTSIPRDPALYYYSAGAEIPPTEFVELTPGLL